MTKQRRCKNVGNSYGELGEWREDQGYARQIRKNDSQTLEWTCHLLQLLYLIHWFELVLLANHKRQIDCSAWVYC